MSGRISPIGTYSTHQAAEMIATALGEPNKVYAYCKRLTIMAQKNLLRYNKSGKFYNFDKCDIEKLIDQFLQVKFGATSAQSISSAIAQSYNTERTFTESELKEIFTELSILSRIGVEGEKLLEYLREKLSI
jgi:flavodoxin